LLVRPAILTGDFVKSFGDAGDFRVHGINLG
jgi:hypothetical protein